MEKEACTFGELYEILETDGAIGFVMVGMVSKIGYLAARRHHDWYKRSYSRKKLVAVE
eukprot:CAMPEP_0172640636 /NCGR_PEP_ID=MMETSP1068-20121228/223911_1 /TAXON_ID=35684 /ORGANISM="Pseudopedinella elastica, Strain CCMP716" /LENGTH=57 /DNA_ID=CAMNT_0013454049 /DNA_START=81 /DNA_END=251 /DNA_ORIENTATION=+